MQFGKLEADELEKADLTLPPDAAHTTKILKKGKGATKFYVGCAKWDRPDWVGVLYPSGTKKKDFLNIYSRTFNALEYNGFYYNQPVVETIRKWVEAVPPGFKFCPKFTQYITHVKRLKDTEEAVDTFIEAIRAFGETFGAINLMPHPQMDISKSAVIEKFIAHVPADIPLFLELRHSSWFENGFNQDMADFLTKHKRGTIITDVVGRRDAAHMLLTTPECFIRFEGNALHPTDYSRIDEWVQRLKIWKEAGLERCYFFMHQQDNEVYSPKLLHYFVEQMNKHCNAGIPTFALYNEGV